MTPNPELVAHIEAHLLPRYEAYDAAHRRDHIEGVIERSMALAVHYDVDPNMVYTIAAYHDTGLQYGRELHHLHSGEILASDVQLTNYFTAEQIVIMREAVEDHRASSEHTPRTIYGAIVAEADRLIEPLTVIRRTIQYGLSHYPTLTVEEHFARCCEHLNEKYGVNGYLKLYIPHSDNAQRLAELRDIIANPTLLRSTFDTIFAEQQAADL